MSRWAAVAVLGVLALLLAAGAAWTVLVVTSDRAQLAAAQQTERQQAQQLRRLQSSITTLFSEVNSLSTPTDPLSAYNQICNQQMINGATGNDQMFYFPCTNSVQTIPQPGG